MPNATFADIHAAITSDKPYEEVESIFKSSHEVTVQDIATGNRPLHVAAQYGKLRILKLLLEKGALVNDANLEGNTPLHFAINADYFDCAIQLKIAGAEDGIKNKEGHAASTGVFGDKSYGIAALASANSVKQLEIAFTICETNLDDINALAFTAASNVAKGKLGSQWTEEHDKRIEKTIKHINNGDTSVPMTNNPTDNTYYHVDDAQAMLSCRKGGVFDILSIQCF